MLASPAFGHKEKSLFIYFTHGQSIVRESSSTVDVFVHFFLGCNHVLDEIDGEGRDNDVEILQVRVLILVKLLAKDVDQELKDEEDQYALVFSAALM